MHRSSSLRPRPASAVDPKAIRRAALALRGFCRKHGLAYPLNRLINGQLAAAACPHCFPGMAAR